MGEGSLEVKLPTIWTDGKAEVARVREEKRRREKRKSQNKEDAGAQKGKKVVKHCVVPMICGSGGSESRLAKAADAEPSGQMSTCRSQKRKKLGVRSTFGRSDVVLRGRHEGFCTLPKVSKR